MRRLWKLVGLSAMILGLGLPGVAFPDAARAVDAQANLVDGTIGGGDRICHWRNAQTSDNPPNPTTIDRTTIYISCSDGSSQFDRPDSDLEVTFADDTATIESFQWSGTLQGVTCSYEARNMLLQHDANGAFSGGPYTFYKTSGGFFCPETAQMDSLSLFFH